MRLPENAVIRCLPSAADLPVTAIIRCPPSAPQRPDGPGRRERPGKIQTLHYQVPPGHGSTLSEAVKKNRPGAAAGLMPRRRTGPGLEANVGRCFLVFGPRARNE